MRMYHWVIEIVRKQYKEYKCTFYIISLIKRKNYYWNHYLYEKLENTSIKTVQLEQYEKSRKTSPAWN